MVQFGAESWIPVMVGLTTIQELSPLITGLVAAGKVGSNIGAELSSRRVTEQIEAMDVSGTNFKKQARKEACAAADSAVGSRQDMPKNHSWR
jgi:ABC-type transporter Mla maintaining outer membrane lipid asymmetry permease subunit MlaE